MTNLGFCYKAIQHTTDNIRRVDRPFIAGTNSQVLIVETFDGKKTVFRFNDRCVAHRNHDVSQVLANHGVDVPQIKLHLYNGQYFETYPYVSGLTMQEYLDMGMTHQQIQDNYATIALQMKKIADIPVQNFQNIKNKNCASVAQSNIVNRTHSWVLGQFVKYGTKMLNYGPQSICHCDLTPRNIVLDDNMNLMTILDLNAVSVANINFSVAITGLSLEHNNLNKQDFYSVCNDIMPNRIHRQQIDIIENICKLYFRCYVR
ncbi:MAG: phosphotransferase [Alphaproteobacteria bacterium]|nr:phosphotransferase [Alphaproteobacteria bacterium]